MVGIIEKVASGVAPSQARGLKQTLSRRSLELISVAPSQARGLKPDPAEFYEQGMNQAERIY